MMAWNLKWRSASIDIYILSKHRHIYSLRVGAIHSSISVLHVHYMFDYRFHCVNIHLLLFALCSVVTFIFLVYHIQYDPITVVS